MKRGLTMRWAVVTVLALLTGCCGPYESECTARQNDALGAAMFAHPYRQAPRVSTTNCVRSGDVVNCTGF